MFCKEENWVEVRKTLEEEAVSIDHVVKEVANAIWKRAVIPKARISGYNFERFQILKQLVTDGIVKLENELRYIDTAFRIALENGISDYDASYIVQALELKTPLFTNDRVRSRIAERLGVVVRYIP